MADNWGHKLTVSIYVPGDEAQAEIALQCIEGQMLIPNASFVGVKLDVVEEEPNDQIAS